MYSIISDVFYFYPCKVLRGRCWSRRVLPYSLVLVLPVPADCNFAFCIECPCRISRNTDSTFAIHTIFRQLNIFASIQKRNERWKRNNISDFSVLIKVRLHSRPKDLCLRPFLVILSTLNSHLSFIKSRCTLFFSRHGYDTSLCSLSFFL